MNEQAEFESSVLSCLDSQPFSVKFITSDSTSATYGYVDGRELFYSADGKKMGEALAALHSFPPAHPPKFAPYISCEKFIQGLLSNSEKSIPKNPHVPRDAADFAMAAIANSKPALPAAASGASSGCLVHNDLVARNVIVDNSGQPHLIDWTWALHSDAVLDLLSYTCPIITSWDYEHFISGGQEKAFLLAYCASRNLDGAEKKALLLILSSLAKPYFAATLGWALSEFVGSSWDKSTQERLCDMAFLRRASAASEGIAKRISL